MNHIKALDYIRSTAQFGSKLGLEKVARLCELLGNPQDAPRVVHVAGTNGKGSTCAMIASVLQAAGYRTGLYTSPYVESMRDSTRVNGQMMTDEEFAAATEQVREKALLVEAGHPTQFEVETGIAFQWFRQSRCDFVVLETGLGGRLDATNVVHRPTVTVITSISFDHMAYLGDTIEKITAEKCGILKHGAVAVSDPLQPSAAMGVIRDRAAKIGNPLRMPDWSKIVVTHTGLDGNDIFYGGLNLHIPLIGKHQIANALTAVEALFALREQCGARIPNDAIATGIANVSFPLRQEILRRSPLVLLDGAHNADGARTLADSIASNLAGRRIAVIMGMLADKEYEPAIGSIAALAGKFIAVEPRSPRALPAEITAQVASRSCVDVSRQRDYRAALAEGLRYAGTDGAVVVCGSLYLAGPMRGILLSDEKQGVFPSGKR